jgi:hypothetical protein
MRRPVGRASAPVTHDPADHVNPAGYTGFSQESVLNGPILGSSGHGPGGKSSADSRLFPRIEAYMGPLQRRRRSFRPSLDGSRLEVRMVPSTTGVAASDLIQATATDGAPTNHGTLKSGYVQATGTMLHSAFQAFINQTKRAAQKAVNNLGKGQNEASLVASLDAFTALQGGILEAKVQQISMRLPGGGPYLFDPSGPVPANGSPINTYIPMNQRLKVQIDNMLAQLKANSFVPPSNNPMPPTNVPSLQAAVSPNQSLLILQTYQGSKAALNQYIQLATQNGDFFIVRG